MGHSVMGTREAAQPIYTDAYTRYALGVFTAVYMVNLLDRQLLAILIEPIRTELGLSDTQIGFLSGISFAIFYTFLGLPIARLADHTNRRNIVAVAAILWSVMTAACGLAASYGWLLVARIGVAIGQAGATPPIHSLISDYFPPQRRTSAMAIYAIGAALGGVLSFAAGGILSQIYGWRMAFIIMGIPGIFLGMLMLFTVREPPRGHWESTASSEAAPPISTVLKHLWELKTFRHLSLGGALAAFALYSMGQWTPAFFIRVHEMSLAQAGIALAVVGALTTVTGTIAGGMLAERLGRTDRRWLMLLPGLGVLISTPFLVSGFLARDLTTSLLFLAAATLLVSMQTGPIAAITQGLAPPRMRALASAVLLFVLNIIGMGLGPQFTGLISDWLAPAYGVRSIAIALALSAVATAWGAVHFYLASRTIAADLAKVEQNAGA